MEEPMHHLSVDCKEALSSGEVKKEIITGDQVLKEEFEEAVHESEEDSFEDCKDPLLSETVKELMVKDEELEGELYEDEFGTKEEQLSEILSKADSLGPTHSYTGQQRIVHDFACLLEGHMQGIPEDSWHEFQIDCLNLVHRYRQRRQLFQQPQQQPPMNWPAPQQQQPWQPPQQQQFWHQPATWQAPPQQQPQQQPPARQPSPLTWLPPQSPQSSGQSSWTRTTECEPGMPPAPSPTLVQTPSPTPAGSSLSATFKTPVTPLSFPALTPGSVNSSDSLAAISPSTLFTKDLDTPPAQRVSPGSGTSTSKYTE